MARIKLRNIVVDGTRYLWRFQASYRLTDHLAAPYRCHDRFIAFLEGQVTSPLKIMLDTWECPIVGGPLRCGAPIDLHHAASTGMNWHTPRWAAILIRAGLEYGWQPTQRKSPCSIANGVALLEMCACYWLQVSVNDHRGIG